MDVSAPIRTRELAALAGVTPKTIRAAARAGIIPALRIGRKGHYLFQPHVVEELLGVADDSGRGSRPADR